MLDQGFDSLMNFVNRAVSFRCVTRQGDSRAGVELASLASSLYHSLFDFNHGVPMTSALIDLEPKPVWKHFDVLAATPRASTKEAAARGYVLSLAKRLGLEATHDGVGNTVIRKPACPGRESVPMTLLQGHLDMVCEKNEGTAHNFDTDPIRVVRDGDWLKADGTTLGSDNGVGVSAALAVMESTDIAHGPLEFVFTIEEETGLTGAAEFPGGILKSKYFLNLDNEEKDTICIGCSGGVKTTAWRKVTLVPATGGAAWRVKVFGLKGGHSGVDIHQGRGNALRVLGNVLQRELERLPLEIASIQGFMTAAYTAWRNDPENYRLWGALNLTMCMWMYRQLVLRDGAKKGKSLTLNLSQFGKCLMSISATQSYVDWLLGRNLSDRDRSPCYSRLKTIFVKRLIEENYACAKKPMFPAPEWHRGGGGLR